MSTVLPKSAEGGNGGGRGLSDTKVELAEDSNLFIGTTRLQEWPNVGS